MTEKLKRRPSNHKKLIKDYKNLENLLSELETRTIPTKLKHDFDQLISSINGFSGSEKALSKLIVKNHLEIIKTLHTELNIVPKNHYQNLWMAIGMSAFGLPLGVIIFALTQNAAFIAIGLPIGLPIGMAIGAEKDKKAKKEGRQLQIDQI